MVPLPGKDRVPVRVLLVEDEFFIRMDVADALRQAGFQVVEVGTADDAVTFLQSGESMDLVFTDIHMPGALNGLTLAERLRASFPMLPILIGSVNIGMEREASRVGKFVPKPYNLLHLVTLIADMLSSPCSEGSK